MEDLNCPSCGTTQPNIAPGFCECCGYEFTENFIAEFLHKQKRKDDAIKRKIAEEERKKRILREKEEKERKARRKAELEAQKRAMEAAKKEREEREKLRSLLEKDNERFDKELRFSVPFKKFRKIISTAGIVLVVICVVLSAAFAANGEQIIPISPQNEISTKIKNSYYSLTYPVDYDEDSAHFNIVEKSKDNTRLSIGTIKFINSISTLINNRTSIKEKFNYTFPHISSLLESKVGTVFEKSDDKYLIDNAGLFNDSEKEELIELLSTSRNENMFDIVVVTTTDFAGKSAQDYADDYYDYNNYGYGESKDGCILVINSESREWYISTCGFGIEAINDKGINTISSKITPKLKKNKYFDACKIYINQSTKLVKKAHE